MSSSEVLAIIYLLFIQVFTKEDQIFVFFFNVFLLLINVSWFPNYVFRDFSLYNSISTSVLTRQPEITSEVCFETPICTCF